MDFRSRSRKKQSARPPDVTSACDFPTLVQVDEQPTLPRWGALVIATAQEHSGESTDEMPEEPIEPEDVFYSNKLITLLDTHIAETRAKFPDDPPYEGVPDYDEEEEEDS